MGSWDHYNQLGRVGDEDEEGMMMPVFRIEWSERHAIELPFVDKETAHEWWMSTDLFRLSKATLTEYFDKEIEEVEG